MQRSRKALISVGVTLFTVFAMVSPASAHVTVTPKVLKKGSYGTLDFKVPNEKSNASTNKIEINIPIEHPISSVSVQPIPGWTYAVAKTTLDKPVSSEEGDITEVVSKVTYSGGNIKPGEFEDFEISVGPLPAEVDVLEFKTVQTYTDGSVVRWIDPEEIDGKESEHPAPTVDLTAADVGITPISAPAAAESDDSDNSTKVVSIIAISLAVLALIVATTALITKRKE